MLPSAAPRDRVRLLGSPAEAYDAMLAAIDRARVRVQLELYAFLHDRVGARFVAALGAAARRGVDVRVTLDAWGSVGSARAIVRELRRAGCEARVHNRLLAVLGGHLGRNHRKLLVVDDALAYVGGINVGERFAAWDDLAVELRGPVCRALGRRLRGERHVEQDGRIRVHLSRMRGGRRLFRRYLKAFGSAERRLLVAHSYFLPGPRLLRSLRAAARRGVEVTLLVPGRSDVPLARTAMAAIYGELVRAGVRVFEWTPSVLHAKLAVVDGKRLLLGSFNLDPFSLANLEALVVADDAEAAQAGARWIETRVARARRVGATSSWSSRLGRALGRALASLATRFARLLKA